jgi:DNA-binding MarR family transcriptional regulator
VLLAKFIVRPSHEINAVDIQTNNEPKELLPCAPGLVAEQAAELEWLLPRVARQLGMVYVDPLAPDITIRQLHVCMLLESGPLTISEISRKLGVCLSATTQIADRLEKSGMVERIPNGLDRRAKYLRLTLQGCLRMRQWRELRLRRARTVLSQLSQECRIEVLHMLNVLATAAGEVSETVLQTL